MTFFLKVVSVVSFWNSVCSMLNLLVWSSHFPVSSIFHLCPSVKLCFMSAPHQMVLCSSFEKHCLTWASFFLLYLFQNSAYNFSILQCCYKPKGLTSRILKQLVLFISIDVSAVPLYTSSLLQQPKRYIQNSCAFMYFESHSLFQSPLNSLLTIYINTWESFVLFYEALSNLH